MVKIRSGSKSYMKITLAIYCSLLGCLEGIAQVSGPLSGHNFSTAAIPGSSQTWTNLLNADASDDKYAVTGNIGNPAGSFTDYLVITDFGFNIPAGTLIKGIKVEIERSDPNGKTSDYSIRIVRAGLIGTAERSDGLAYPLSDAVQSYGGPADLWDESWSYKDITNNNFGVAIAAQRNSGSGSTAGQIDNVMLTVYYGYQTLPLVLNSFTLQKEENAVRLGWKTAAETGMDHFTVERSSDGRLFRPLSDIACTNQSLSEYAYRDISPLAGTSWYRLQMHENSGQVYYSKVIPVSFSQYDLLTLSPSPWRKGSDLFISNPSRESLTICFYDGGGRLLGKTITATSRVNLSFADALKDLIYFKVFDKDSQLKGSGNFIVQ